VSWLDARLKLTSGTLLLNYYCIYPHAIYHISATEDTDIIFRKQVERWSKGMLRLWIFYNISAKCVTDVIKYSEQVRNCYYKLQNHQHSSSRIRWTIIIRSAQGAVRRSTSNARTSLRVDLFSGILDHVQEACRPRLPLSLVIYLDLVS